MYSPSAVVSPSGGGEGVGLVVSPMQKILLALTIIAALLLGLFPDLVIRLI